MNNKNVVIAAGGTGGHIYPGIALAEKLTEKDYKIIWLGSGSKLEKDILAPYGWHYHSVQAKPYRGTGIWKKIILPAYLLKSFIFSLGYLLRYRPAYLITTGGYVAITSAIAAYCLRIPVHLCEQNAKPGLANRCLAILAKRIFTAYPHVFNSRYVGKVFQIGNPLRQTLITRSQEQKTTIVGNSLRLLVLGGSQGARVFNEHIPRLLQDVQNKELISITHIAGKQGNLKHIQAMYAKNKIQANVKEFIEDISSCYMNVDFVIARAGALTLSELMQFKLPAILVPLPSSADNHQFYNALHHHQRGACWLVDQDKLLQDNYLANLINILLHSDKTITQMKAAADRMQIANVAEKIIETVRKAEVTPASS